MALKRPFSELDWQLTPEPVRQYIMALERTLFDMQQRIAAHEKRLEKLEVRTRKNSHNSSKPPSSDPPFSRKKRKQKKSKKAKGGQKGHEPHQQQMLDPNESHWLMPSAAHAGIQHSIKKTCSRFTSISISNFPKSKMQVSHYILQQCDCPNCGKTVKATLPSDVSTGYGPRFTALIGELSGIKAMSSNDVKQLCESVLGIPIATGTIQKIVDRTSNALLPVYEHIGRIARRFWCNYIDETSWFKENDLHWLWAMVNERVAFYRIDPHRSKEAFEKLVRDWDGILVSDGYGLYRKWVNRQTCLAHLIRKADALAERKKNRSSPLRRNRRRLAEATGIVCQRASRPENSGRIFIRSFCSPSPYGKTIKPMPANWPGRSFGKWTVCGPFSITKALTPPITAPNGPCVLVCCGENAAWARKAKKATDGWNGSCRYEGNLPPKCKTDIPVSRRMYYFLFSKVDAQSFLDLTQTGISRERQKRWWL
jgi:transposase